MVKRKILLIQSTQTHGNGTKQHLEEIGYKVLWAGSGLTALMMARNVSIDLIVLDVALPDIEGLDLCRRFRQQRDTRAIPIILLVSRGYVRDRGMSRSSGPDDYLEKPYTEQELAERVAAVLAPRPSLTVSEAPSSAEHRGEFISEQDSIMMQTAVRPEPVAALITVTAEARQPELMLNLEDMRPDRDKLEVAHNMPSSEDIKPASALKLAPEPLLELNTPEAAPHPSLPEKAITESASSPPLLAFKVTGDTVIDPATGLFGRPQFEAMFTKEFKRSHRFKQQPVSCMLIDLDGQKRGRYAPEPLIKEIIGLVQKTIREVDTAAWWSGESLIVLLPNTLRTDALQAAARILEAVAVHSVEWPGSMDVTMSIGVAGLPDDSIDSEQKMIDAAEAARKRAQDLMSPSPDHAKFLKPRK